MTGRKSYAEHAANVLSYVAHRIEDYLPTETLLEGTELVVRIPDRGSMPTVELFGNMPAPVFWTDADKEDV